MGQAGSWVAWPRWRSITARTGGVIPARLGAAGCVPAWLDWSGSDGVSMTLMAEDLAHHANELQGADVTDAVIHPVGILARGQNPLVAQDCQVL